MEAMALAMSARDRTRSAFSTDREGEGELPGRGRPGRWPAGLLGALGLILILDGIVAKMLIGLHYPSRLTSSWEAAFRAVTEPEAHSEILCFGDSLIKLGILPRILQVRLGQSAYNLAVLGGQPPTSHYLLRRVLDRGPPPRALVVNFSPVLLGLDPQVNLEWWAGLMRGRERIELALRSREPRLAISLILHGAIASLSGREAFRAALGFGPIESPSIDEHPARGEVRALLRNWTVNRGAQVAPRSFVPIPGSLPRPYDGPGWSWQPHSVHADFVERFLAMAGDRQIPVYWIIPPAEAAWLERNRRVGSVDAYRSYVLGLVSRFPLLKVLDLQQARWDRALFRDPIHVNRDGAVRLTLAVADALARSQRAGDVGRRWITLDGARAEAPRLYQHLLEDLDQSRLAVSQGENGPITMEGTR
jgi:hypothetical protein